MRLRLTDGNGSAFRALIASFLVCGVILSVGLAAAPQLHEWLHQSHAPNHECAATLMSNGSWEHSACEPILAPPIAVPVNRIVVTPGLRVIARAEVSILEHAPPANS